MQYDRLTPRIIETDTIIGRIAKIFFEETKNVFRVHYTHARRDFYYPADSVIKRQFNISNNIETRSERVISVGDSLDYKIGPTTLLTLQGNIIGRSVGRVPRFKNLNDARRNNLNTTTEEFKIDGAVQACSNVTSGIDIGMAFYYQERDEKHTAQAEEQINQFVIDSVFRAEERKNNHARRTSLAADVNILLSPADSVTLTGSSSLLRYDTPSLLNDDERDELWYILNLTTHHTINPYLDLQIGRASCRERV